MSLERSKISSSLLNILIPGLGHIYWKEYLFGIFIFLIMLIGVILFVVSFFVSLSIWVVMLLLALPMIFYLFTFVDLIKTINLKSPKMKRIKKTFYIFLAVGLLFQFLVPIAPLNFALRNSPSVFTVERSNMSPLFQQGDVLKTSKLAYSVDLFFMKRPILYALPERYDIIQFEDQNGNKKIGIVLGLPGESIEMFDGMLAVNNYAIPNEPPGNLLLQGNIELTDVGEFSILAATLSLGTVDELYQVTLDAVVGKVEKLF